MRKTLLSAALMIVFSMTMLVGTTYAWWSEEIVVTGNKLETGHLDIDLEIYDEATKKWVNLNELSIKAIFYNDNVKPGDEESKTVRIINKGSIPISYRIGINVNEDNPLREYVKFTINDYSGIDDFIDKEPLVNKESDFSIIDLDPYDSNPLDSVSQIKFTYKVDETLGDEDGSFGQYLTLPFTINFEAVQTAQRDLIESQK
jgi:Camelysin metallo-endopeptidase